MVLILISLELKKKIKLQIVSWVECSYNNPPLHCTYSKHTEIFETFENLHLLNRSSVTSTKQYLYSRERRKPDILEHPGRKKVS